MIFMREFFHLEHDFILKYSAKYDKVLYNKK